MGKNTCGNCQNLQITDAWRGMHTASCGLTDGLIVPHSWANNTITLWRVPEFCENPDKTPSKKQAPKKEWVHVKINNK